MFPNERTQGKSYLNTAAFRGPTWFSRTTNGGSSWETARPIFDPGQNDQTIGNQIVALGNGDLVNVMTVFTNDNNRSDAGGQSPYCGPPTGAPAGAARSPFPAWEVSG